MTRRAGTDHASVCRAPAMSRCTVTLCARTPSTAGTSARSEVTPGTFTSRDATSCAAFTGATVLSRPPWNTMSGTVFGRGAGDPPY